MCCIYVYIAMESPAYILDIESVSYNVLGEIQEKGMLLPFSQHIYRPILSRLEKEGLVAKEHTSQKHVVKAAAQESTRY